jgi:hypothetical protein
MGSRDPPLDLALKSRSRKGAKIAKVGLLHVFIGFGGRSAAIQTGSKNPDSDVGQVGNQVGNPPHIKPPFFMEFRRPQAVRDRRQKPIVCPTSRQAATFIPTPKGWRLPCARLGVNALFPVGPRCLFEFISYFSELFSRAAKRRRLNWAGRLRPCLYRSP